MTEPLTAPRHWLYPEREGNVLESAGQVRRDLPCEVCAELGQWVRVQASHDAAVCVDPMPCSLKQNEKRRVA